MFIQLRFNEDKIISFLDIWYIKFTLISFIFQKKKKKKKKKKNFKNLNN